MNGWFFLGVAATTAMCISWSWQRRLSCKEDGRWWLLHFSGWVLLSTSVGTHLSGGEQSEDQSHRWFLSSWNVFEGCDNFEQRYVSVPLLQGLRLLRFVISHYLLDWKWLLFILAVDGCSVFISCRVARCGEVEIVTVFYCKILQGWLVEWWKSHSLDGMPRCRLAW